MLQLEALLLQKYKLIYDIRDLEWFEYMSNLMKTGSLTPNELDDIRYFIGSVDSLNILDQRNKLQIVCNQITAITSTVRIVLNEFRIHNGVLPKQYSRNTLIHP